MKLLSKTEYLFFSLSTTPRVNESPSAAILFFSIFVMFDSAQNYNMPCTHYNFCYREDYFGIKTADSGIKPHFIGKFDIIYLSLSLQKPV